MEKDGKVLCHCHEILSAARSEDIAEIVRLWTVLLAAEDPNDCQKWAPRTLRDAPINYKTLLAIEEAGGPPCLKVKGSE